jgi:hypothetical protein
VANKEIKISVVDLCIGYGCAAVLMYTIAGAAYFIGKSKAKIEIAEKLQEIVQDVQSAK